MLVLIRGSSVTTDRHRARIRLNRFAEENNQSNLIKIILFG